jgi:hypothetical protein
MKIMKRKGFLRFLEKKNIIAGCTPSSIDPHEDV